MYTWYKDKVPNHLVVKQVYGIVFDDNGNILLREEDGKYKLTGGKPEIFDKDYEDTLRREYLEELNVSIDNIHYLGYLLVEENNEKYAQVRMIATLKSIGEIKPDDDNGKLYGILFCNQKDVKKYLNYKDLAGNEMLDDAIKMFESDAYKIKSNH